MLTNTDLAAFHQSIHDDDILYMSKQISHQEFWDRVHVRDAIVAATPAGRDRRRLNSMGLRCGCAFCRTMPRPGCQCGHCDGERGDPGVLSAADLKPAMTILGTDGTRITVLDCYEVPRSRGRLIWLELANGQTGAVEASECFRVVR